MVVFLLLMLATANVLGAKIEPRLMKGQVAPDGAFPWQASLRNEKGEHYCGGSIINKKWILTAGQCVLAERSISVVVGTNKLSSGGQTYKVEKVILHEGYTARLKDDIMLIKVSGEIEFNDKVKAIELDEKYFSSNQKALATGWGLSNDSPTDLPDNLQMLNVTIGAQNKCSMILRRYTKLSFDEKQNMCSVHGPKEGICYGDSGGPLVKDNKQVGIIGWYVTCGIRNIPDVYIRVSYYYKWIQAHAVE